MSPALAEAALGLVGTPFRLHGRDPAAGLDCVGLVAEALRLAGGTPVPPEGYALRSVSVAQFLRCAAASGLSVCEDEGDVVLCRVGPVQSHLAVRVPGGFVHAHASLGRVTFLPAPLPWPVCLQWRLADEKD
ncbi:MAG: peptidoglycan endopeptidase [Novosphingobium sp.]